MSTTSEAIRDALNDLAIANEALDANDAPAARAHVADATGVLRQLSRTTDGYDRCGITLRDVAHVLRNGWGVRVRKIHDTVVDMTVEKPDGDHLGIVLSLTMIQEANNDLFALHMRDAVIRLERGD